MPATPPSHVATEDDERRQAIVETAGALTGVFGLGYLEELREDWPELPRLNKQIRANHLDPRAVTPSAWATHVPRIHVLQRVTRTFPAKSRYV